MQKIHTKRKKSVHTSDEEQLFINCKKLCRSRNRDSLYVKQTAIPLHAIQNIELLPDRKTTIELIADKTNDLQYKDIIGGQGIVWVWSNDSSKPLQPVDNI